MKVEGWGSGELAMRSLENRRHNGVMEGGSLSPSTPLHSLKRNKGAISIPYLIGGLWKTLFANPNRNKATGRSVVVSFLSSIMG